MWDAKWIRMNPVPNEMKFQTYGPMMVSAQILGVMIYYIIQHLRVTYTTVK